MEAMLCFQCLSARIDKSDPDCVICSRNSSALIRCLDHQDSGVDLIICCDESSVQRAQADGPRFTYDIHGGSCVASIPYYAVEAEETMVDNATSPGRYVFRSQNMLHPRSRLPLSGLDRVNLAYAAGRQAAKVLRGEDTRQEDVAFTTGRSFRFFIVLRGVKSSDYYPRHVSTFSDFKEHVYLDWQTLRPTQLHPLSVSGCFYSQTEAWAYCLGAGLRGYLGPGNDDP